MDSMLEEQARVLEIRGDSVVVEISPSATCDGCEAGTGCGAGLLSGLFRAKKTRCVIQGALDLEVGDQVVIAVSESSLLRGAFLVYLLPLLAMFLGALLMNIVFASAGEGLKIIAGAAGFFLALAWVSRRHRRAGGNTRWRPVIVRRTRPVRTATVPRSP